MSTTQMALGFNIHEDKTFSNYYASGNDELALTLYKVACGRGEQLVYFSGSVGTGRTHLLQSCCHAANKLRLTNLYLPLSTIDTLTTEIFDDLETLNLICIDDIQAIAGRSNWEEAFFDFFNRLFDARKRLIIAGSMSPQHLGLTLPDLVSRLTLGVTFRIHELSESEKMEAIISRAQSRGLVVTPEVVKYVLNHCQRDLGSLFYALDRLDQASLEAQRRLTIPFVKTVLNL